MIALILLVGAIVCFALAVARFPSPKIDLLPLGLLLWACASLVSRV